MESVQNAANAASKMIWGDNTTATSATNETGGKEPISGEQGKGTATEPFDKGNTENPTSTEHATTGNTSTPNITNQEPTGNQPPVSEKPSTNTANAASGGPPRPEHETDKTGVVGGMSDSRKAEDIRPSETSENPGAAPESGLPPKQKQQGADAPLNAPEGKEESAVKEKKDEGEEALAKRDPNDHSGEPLKVHDGGEETLGKTQAERRESKVGNPGGQEHGKEEKGTGEQWVKTSGLAADGGDFDATKPGAGREADRLLEQKGVHRTEPGEKPATTADSDDKADKADKPGLGQKIKDKLHLGHKDK